MGVSDHHSGLLTPTSSPINKTSGQNPLWPSEPAHVSRGYRTVRSGCSDNSENFSLTRQMNLDRSTCDEACNVICPANWPTSWGHPSSEWLMDCLCDCLRKVTHTNVARKCFYFVFYIILDNWCNLLTCQRECISYESTCNAFGSLNSCASPIQGFFNNKGKSHFLWLKLLIIISYNTETILIISVSHFFQESIFCEWNKYHIYNRTKIPWGGSKSKSTFLVTVHRQYKSDLLYNHLCLCPSE